jgi:adenylylsulfate kinase-like enzyme
MLQNGRRIQILDAGEVRRFVHPSTSPPIEEQVAAVSWIAGMLAKNDIDVIVCCTAPIRDQRTAIRHKSYEEGVPLFEVWVDGGDITEDLERRFGYEHPDPPDSRAIVTGSDGWEELARRVIFELDI